MNIRYATRLAVLCYLVLTINSALGQTRNFFTEKDLWYPGILVMQDGRKITGELNYNFVTGILSHRHANGSDAYLARRVSYFVLYGESSQPVKKFYSMPLRTEDPDAGMFTFYESVYEKGDLAILSRHIFEHKERAVSAVGPDGIPMYQGTANIENVFEVLYLADRKGNILEYAVKKKDRDVTYGWSYSDPSLEDRFNESNTLRDEEKKYRIINDDALSALVGDHYSRLEAYIKSEEVDIKTLKGLYHVLNFCAAW